MTRFVESIYLFFIFDMIISGERKMRIDLILNELLKKVEYANIWVETINLKELDKKSINRL